MKRIFSSLAVLSLCLCLGGIAQAKSYINGIDANYPPFGYVGEDGKPSGFDVEAMTWIANKMGFEIVHQPMDWDGIIPALLAKKIDMVCSGMSITPTRQEQVNFSNPYWTLKKVFIVKTDSSLSMEQIMEGTYRVGVQRGTSEHEHLEKMVEAGAKFELRFYDSSPMAIEDLLNGRLDAVGLDSPPAEDAIRRGKSVKIVGVFVEGDQFGVAIRKEDTDLLNTVNEGYKLLLADPYWEELQAKFLQ